MDKIQCLRNKTHNHTITVAAGPGPQECCSRQSVEDVLINSTEKNAVTDLHAATGLPAALERPSSISSRRLNKRRMETESGP